MITGAAISLTLFLLQLVIALNNDAAAKREKETTSLQSLILALNMGPDLRGLDATGLDDMVYSPKRGKILPGLGTPNTAAARDLCLPQTNKRPPVESKILPQIRLVGKNLDFANFSGLLLKDVDLSHASLRRAKFCHAQLVNVKLQQANLSAADFRDAEVKDSDLQFAKMPEATVWVKDFSGTKVNLETCWPERLKEFTKYMKEWKLAPQTIGNNPGSPLYGGEPSLQVGWGHPCHKNEAADFWAGKEFWFVTPEKVREMASQYMLPVR